jgi:hypothetical protein
MSGFFASIIIFGLMGLALSLGTILGRGGLKCHCNDGSCATDHGKGQAAGHAVEGCCGQHSDCAKNQAPATWKG